MLYRGPMHIEIDRRRVMVDEVEVALRPKEYGLLLTLAFEPGRVFSRQDLLDAVWVKTSSSTSELSMCTSRGYAAS